MRPRLRLLRSLGSWRVGAAVAIATLAIGIGTATSMYALVRVALTSTIPDIDDLAALGRIYASSRALGVERSPLTGKDLTLLAGAASFESVGAYVVDDDEIELGGQPTPVTVAELSEGFFPAMRAHAASGRLLSERDVQTGAQVAVVSDALWRTRFGGQSLAAAVVTIDGVPRTIVGVLPPGFGFSFIGIAADVWIPLARHADSDRRSMSMLARLKPGVTWSAAQSELDALGRGRTSNGLWTWSAIPVEQDIRTRSAGGLFMMFGPALVVLLIGCTNVACMLLARGIDRDTELSVRCALGATRARILGQLLAENLVLALAGGVLGLALAHALLAAVASALAQFRPQAAALVPSTTTLMPIALTVSIAACLLFGVWPALRLSRRDIVTSLKGGTRTASARFAGYHARDLVVFVEVGVAVGLVVTTAFFVRFFVELQRITPLFPADEIIIVNGPARDLVAAAESVRGLPGVAAVTMASAPPGAERARSTALVRAADGRSVPGAIVAVTPSYFAAVGIPIVRGRPFTTGEAAVAVVSERAAARLWGERDPLGAGVSLTGSTGISKATIVGVCRNALDAGGLARTGLLPPEIYVPLDAATTPELLLIARTAADPRLLLKPMTDAVARAAGAGTVPGARSPRAQLLAPTFVHDDSAFVIRLFGGFALIALLLAATGVFGVLSQSVAQRTTEFGVRMAMGATPARVLRMVLVREGKLIVAAVASGAAITVLATHAAFAEMLAISGSDPRIWIGVAALCGGTAALAVWLATWRIVKLDPWVILRGE